MSERTAPQIATTLSTPELEPQGGTTSKYKLWRDMRKDPTIALARWLSVAPVLTAEWSVEHTLDAPEGAVDLVRREVLPLKIHYMRSAMYGCVDYGWQAYEKVLTRRDDGSVGLDKLKPLFQDLTTILVDVKTGAFTGLLNGTQEPRAKLDVEECLLCAIDVEGTDWYGQSIMAVAEAPHKKWNLAEGAAARYDQKVAGANWVVYYPVGVTKVDGADQDNFLVAKTILAALESTGSVAVPRLVDNWVDELDKESPNSWFIELLGDGSPKQYSFANRLGYIDSLKVRAFGIPERAILEGQFGTKAEAETHGDLATTNMEVRALILVQLLNWHVVNHLLRLNYGPGVENTVYVQMAPIADANRAFLRKVYESIVASPDGALLEISKIDLEAMRDKLGVPTMPEADAPADDGGAGDPPENDIQDDTEE